VSSGRHDTIDLRAGDQIAEIASLFPNLKFLHVSWRNRVDEQHLTLKNGSLNGLSRLKYLSIHVLLPEAYGDMDYADNLWPISEVNMFLRHLQHTTVPGLRIKLDASFGVHAHDDPQLEWIPSFKQSLSDMPFPKLQDFDLTFKLDIFSLPERSIWVRPWGLLHPFD
jgi:hypothetical protein